MDALWQWIWGRLLTKMSESGIRVVLCAAIVVVGIAAVAFVKEIEATKPSIQRNTKNGPIRVKFPSRASRK